MELSYILQVFGTAVLAAVTGGVVGWAGVGLASTVRSALAAENAGPSRALRGLRHAPR